MISTSWYQPRYGHNKSNSHGGYPDSFMTSGRLQTWFLIHKLGRLLDALYGHRRILHGYSWLSCSNEFDQRLPEIIAAMRRWSLWWLLQTTEMIQLMQVQTILWIYALLVYSPSFKVKMTSIPGHFSDISATVAENFGVDKAMIGESFWINLSKMKRYAFWFVDKRWWSSQGSHGWILSWVKRAEIVEIFSLWFYLDEEPS